MFSIDNDLVSRDNNSGKYDIIVTEVLVVSPAGY